MEEEREQFSIQANLIHMELDRLLTRTLKIESILRRELPRDVDMKTATITEKPPRKRRKISPESGIV